VNGKETTSFTQGQLVKVTLNVDPALSKTNNVYQVTDFLPSGLKPITRTYNYNYASYLFGDSCNYWFPDLTEGNRISFTVYRGSYYYTLCKEPGLKVVYYARVVTTGTYTADPAIISPLEDPANLNTTSKTQINIK
jgi:uncharacterized protein YfaS (alpha-2-macroglobulin family)